MSSVFDSLKNLLGFYLSKPSWDLLVVLFLFSGVLLYGFMVGRNRLTLLLLASYPAILISSLDFSFLGWGKFLSSLNSFQMLFLKSFFFFVLLLFIFWIFNKPGFFRSNLSLKWGQVLFLSVLNAGLWSSTLLGFVNESGTALSISGLALFLFGSSFSQLLWLILPIVYVFFVKELG